jgi:histidyl-tRNA synthetase
MKQSNRSRLEIDKALYIAAHFGFRPIEPPKINESDKEIVKDCLEVATEPQENHFVCEPSEKAAFLRTYTERGYVNTPHPLALAWRRQKQYSLELVGFPFGVAEAKLIRTSLSILNEEGYKDLVVEINSIGDKDSILAFERELHNFARKIQHTFSPEVRTLVKDNVFSIAAMSNLESPKPQSVATLSSSSRVQFKEVLDYLEALGVEFRIVPELVGNRHFCTETLFTIRDQANTLLAGGFRYSRLSKRFGLKKDISFMGTTIFADAKKVSALKIYKDIPHPKFYLVQLGREAKLRALPLIELLRTNHIPMYHFLGKDKITAQMQTAETLGVPYLLIIGQKEALEGTVTVRNTNTRAQDTICVNDLPHYLKHLPF